ncbi:MAG: MFS transporter [Thermomicrobiales bacterium]
MTSPITSSDASALAQTRSRARRAISIVFFINGMTLATWISRIPTITDRLDLSNAQVGMSLMAIAAGALVAFPLSGKRISTHSSRNALTVFSYILIAALPFIGLASNLWLLVPILFCLGFGNGGMDVAMNAQGVEVERVCRKPILSSMHGFYSLGAFAGAGIGAVAAGTDIHPFPHFILIAILAIVGLYLVQSTLVDDAADERTHKPEPTFAFPPRVLWLLGAVVLAAAVGEGAMADWGGLYLQNHLGTSGSIAAFGFAMFSLAMLIGRFSGDLVVARFGPVHVVRYGGLIAGIGLAIGIAINQPWSAIAGYCTVGIGLAAAFPLVFRAAAHHPTIARGRAVAAVATIGYTGFLAGPPILGWIAEWTSLRVLMAMVALLCIVCAAFAPATSSAGYSDTAVTES